MVKSPVLKTLLVIPNIDIIGWEKLMVKSSILENTVILNLA